MAAAVERKVLNIEDGSIDQKSRAQGNEYLRNGEWLSLVRPALAHRITAVDDKSDGFPDEDRMMPTRLGLVLRSAEDRLAVGQEGENLRGFVIGNLHRIDPATSFKCTSSFFLRSCGTLIPQQDGRAGRVSLYGGGRRQGRLPT